MFSFKKWPSNLSNAKRKLMKENSMSYLALESQANFNTTVNNANVVLAMQLRNIERCLKEKDFSSGLTIISQLLHGNTVKAKPTIPTKIQFGTLSVDKTNGAVRLKGDNVELTSNEFKLLIMFVENPNVIISRDTLHETILKTEYDGLNRAIDNTVSRIRKKLGDDCLAQLKIKSIRGKGYLFSSNEW